MERELAGLRDSYIFLMRETFESGDMGTGDRAKHLFMSEYHKAHGSYHDYHWLRRQFSEDYHEIALFSLALAQALYPEKTWEIIEGEEHAVVADDIRTIVFDFIYHDKLTALESLKFAQDEKSDSVETNSTE